MDFIIIGSIAFTIFLIIRLYKYYDPTIDIVSNTNSISILFWYTKRETHAGIETEIRYYKTLLDIKL